MRNMTFGFGAAVLVAAMLAFAAAPVSAGVTKTCWSHTDTDEFLEDGVTPNPNVGQRVPVWANGGGHDKHALDGLDTSLGDTESREACVTLFSSGI